MGWAVGVALQLQLSDVFEGKPELEKNTVLRPASDPRHKMFLKREQTFFNYKKDGKPQKQLLQSTISRNSHDRTAIQNNPIKCNLFFYHSHLDNKSIHKGCK